MKALIFIVGIFFLGALHAQPPIFSFGEEMVYGEVMSGRKAKSQPVQWMQVNTTDTTWYFQKNELVCKGHPIGVIRSKKKYENFILHIEWKHIEAGGNSGTFVWSDAEPGENRLPNGVEVQMLELDWVNLNIRNGEKPPVAYVHGELFGVGGVEIVPDNPRGVRSKSVENRCSIIHNCANWYYFG